MVAECTADYPRIENAKESFEDWTGEDPAPEGGKVTFTCKEGFTDGSTMHTATCSSDGWRTTFTEDERITLCPPASENVSDIYDQSRGVYWWEGEGERTFVSVTQTQICHSETKYLLLMPNVILKKISEISYRLASLGRMRRRDFSFYSHGSGQIAHCSASHIMWEFQEFLGFTINRDISLSVPPLLHSNDRMPGTIMG